MKKWLETEAITGVPRWFILLALLTFGIATGIGQWMVFYLYPARLGIINILAGLALAGGGLYPWLLACEYGIWEVYEMVISRIARRRAEEQAEKRIEERAQKLAEELVAKRAEESERRAAEMAAVLEWYEQHKEQLSNVPPPPGIARDDHSDGAG